MDFEKIKKEHNISLIEEIIVETPDGELSAFVRQPKLNELDLWLYESEENFALSVRRIAETIWLGGDEAIKSNELNYQSFLEQMQKMFIQYQVRYTSTDLTYTIQVLEEDEDGDEVTHTCRVRFPKLEELPNHTSRNPLMSFQKLVTKLWVDGDLECRTNPLFLFGIMLKWKDITAKRLTRLKKR